MSETKRVRELLTKCGVEWEALDGVHPVTVWHDGQFTHRYTERTLLGGVTPYMGEVVDGTGRLESTIDVCSPEQAIAATLGSCNCTNSERTKGTCEWRYEPTDDDDEYDHKWVTSCGWEWDAEGSNELDENGRIYCPRCGGQIEVVGE